MFSSVFSASGTLRNYLVWPCVNQCKSLIFGSRRFAFEKHATEKHIKHQTMARDQKPKRKNLPKFAVSCSFVWHFFLPSFSPIRSWGHHHEPRLPSSLHPRSSLRRSWAAAVWAMWCGMMWYDMIRYDRLWHDMSEMKWNDKKWTLMIQTKQPLQRLVLALILQFNSIFLGELVYFKCKHPSPRSEKLQTLLVGHAILCRLRISWSNVNPSCGCSETRVGWRRL